MTADDRLYVYHREHCRRCGTAIATLVLGGRPIWFCPTCQPSPHGHRPRTGTAAGRAGGAGGATAGLGSPTVNVHDLPTPALVIDAAALEHNIDTMAAARPGRRCVPTSRRSSRPSWPARSSERGGHHTFCCATLREMEGMAAAGLGEDLLLANETLDAERLRALVRRGDARITVAVDSPETVEVAAAAGAEVLVDVDVGLPRCGCLPEEAGAIADLARARGLRGPGRHGLRGPRGGQPRPGTPHATWSRSAMALLRRAHDDVGGEVTSAGGTGTYDLHRLGRRGPGRVVPADGHPLRAARPPVPPGPAGGGRR